MRAKRLKAGEVEGICGGLGRPGEPLFFSVWLPHAACGILVCQPEIEPALLVLESWSLNYWTSGKAQPGESLLPSTHYVPGPQLDPL